MVGTALSPRDDTASRFFSGAISALFMAMIMGLEIFLISPQSFRSDSSSQAVGSAGRGALSRAALICPSVIFSPLSLSARIVSGLLPFIFACLAIFPRPSLMISLIQQSISCLRNVTSSVGSNSPTFPGIPSIFVLPLTSTTLINASACLRSSKNLFPRPLPCQASGTRPATSRRSTGIILVPFMHRELWGLHVTPSSLQGHGYLTYPTPLLGSIVVKG